MLTILAAMLVFGILITVHELGHFIVAKLTGMRVDEFSIGFGPKLCQTTQGPTTYSLRIIPLGGYNKIAGMDPEEEPVTDGFSSKPILSRMLVILAGSFMNFILPIILFFGMFFIGGMDAPSSEPVIGAVLPNQPAATAGLMPGDRIVTINGHKITNWNEAVADIRAAGTQEVNFVIERAGHIQNYQMTPVMNKQANRPMVGVSPSFVKEKVGAVDSAKYAVLYTKQIIKSMLNGLTQIVTGKAAADVAGPIGVAQMAGNVAEQGLVPLFGFIALLSINLAIINLLPIPALDGGHFVVLLVEAVRGKPLSAKYLNAIQMVGVALILAITAFSTFKDITR